TVTSLDPAVPQDPYRNYVVGALKPDDFGSFEVTFSAEGQTSVPIQMSFKDADGNTISTQQTINLGTTVSTDQSSNPSILLPVIGVIIIIAVVGGYLYLRKRKAE
ncbi:MAG: hypothetical protein WC391_07290, partial [Methanoregula sp.]